MRTTKPELAAAAMVLLGLVACGSDGSDETGAAAGGEGPVLAVFTRLTNPEGRNFYLHLMRETPRGGTLDYTKAFEFGEAYASIHGGFVYISDREAMTITKHAVTSDLKIEAKGTVSLQGLGVAFAGIGWVGDQPYVVDAESAQVVRFNPNDMTLIDSTPIPEAVLVRDGITGGSWSWNPVERDGRAYFGWSWMDYDAGKSASVVALASFPTSPAAPVFAEPVVDTRCKVNDGFPFLDAAKNIYVVGLGSWAPELGQERDPSCVVRIRPGATNFDPEYFLDLLAVVGARDIATSWPMAVGSKLLVQYWPESVPAPAADEEWWERSVLELAVVDLAAKTSVRVTGVKPGTSMSYFSLELDGERYVQVYDLTGDLSDSTLYRVTPNGAAEVVVKAGPNSDFQNLGRVR
jgi:hypothetical protein